MHNHLIEGNHYLFTAYMKENDKWQRIGAKVTVSTWSLLMILLDGKWLDGVCLTALSEQENEMTLDDLMERYSYNRKLEAKKVVNSEYNLV